MKAHQVSSRFRTIVITANWILAAMINALDLYAYELVKRRNGETICTYANNCTLSFKMYYKVRVSFCVIGPLITITFLYCVIAVTLHCSIFTFVSFLLRYVMAWSIVKLQYLVQLSKWYGLFLIL